MVFMRNAWNEDPLSMSIWSFKPVEIILFSLRGAPMKPSFRA